MQLRTVLIALLAMACVLGAVSPGSASQPDKTHACHGTVLYGTSSIEVTRSRHVSCARAKRLARAAVVYRVNAGFPDTFCKRGYCWRFGEARGDQPGSSRIPFTGRRGDRRINAIQMVS